MAVSKEYIDTNFNLQDCGVVKINLELKGPIPAEVMAATTQ